jgi:hypothetical protein
MCGSGTGLVRHPSAARSVSVTASAPREPWHSGEGSGVRVEVKRGFFGNETVRVRFPAGTGGAIEVAQAAVTDANGQSVPSSIA